MNISELRINLIKLLIDFNEKLFFERKLLNYYRRELGKSCKTVIDIGANKGQSIDFFLRLNPECLIYAIEPNPDLFKLLKQKYNNKPNIKLFNIGISNESGLKIFNENIFDYTSTFEDLNTNSSYLKKKARILGVKSSEIVKKQYPVKVELLDAFIRNNINHQIDVLKIDTEGHEYYCLLGLFQNSKVKNIRFIQIENHNDDMYKNRIPFSTINRLLEEYGFTECQKIKHAIGNYDELIFNYTITK